jgi:hypothetical protein
MNNFRQFHSLPQYKDAQAGNNDTEVQTPKTDRCTQVQFPVFSQIQTTQQLTSWTGIHSFKLADAILTGVRKYIEKYFPKNKFEREHPLISLEDHLLLTLTKLKQNNSFTYLSVIFNIHRTTCSKYFADMIEILAKVLENFVYDPSRESIDDNMPSHFVNYCMCKYILDCTEIPVCSPKCICCMTQLYSYYKCRHTLKNFDWMHT